MNFFYLSFILLISSLVSSLVSSFASAEELGITVGPKNELIISASNCELLLKQETALCEWKKYTDPDFVIPNTLSKSCLPVSKGKVKLVISTCLPQFTKNYHAKRLINEGPNCWGTAMSFHKLSPTPRFMWPEEITYWMDSSPLCRKLSPGEKMLPGDVINVYAPEKMTPKEREERDAGSKFWESLYPNRFTPAIGDVGGNDYTGFHRLLHSVTYVSDKLAFGKDSPARDDRFYFHPLEEVYGRPSGASEVDCKENQTLNPYIREYQKVPKKIKGTKCSYFSQAYRCENFAHYFKSASLSLENTEILKRVQTLQDLQQKLLPMLTSTNKVFKESEVTQAIALVNITMLKAAEELKRPASDKEREMLLTQEYFAAAGLKQTLEQTGLFKPILP